MSYTDTTIRDITPEGLALLGAPKMVYVREVDLTQLQAEGAVAEDASMPAGVRLFAVHAANGERMAVLDNREAAFLVARQNEMEPVSVH